MAEPNFWKHIERLTLEDLESLRELGARERTRLDYKGFRVPPEKEIDSPSIADDFCALANAGGGRIVFGAVDDGSDGIKKFQGVPEPRHQAARSMIRAAAHAVEPPPTFDMSSVALPDGSLVIVAEVSPGAAGPHQHKGKYFLRLADGNRTMPHSSVVHAVLAANQQSAPKQWQNFERPLTLVGTGSPFEVGWDPIYREKQSLPGYFLGAQLSPTYAPAGKFCHPVSDEAKAMAEACGDGARRGPFAIVAEPPVIADEERLRIDVILDRGVAASTRLLKPGTTASSGLLLNRWQNGLRRLGRILSAVSPALLVDVTLALWTHTSLNGPLTISWSGPDEDEQVSVVDSSFHFTDEVASGVHVGELVADLDYVNALCERGLELLRLHVDSARKG